MKLISFAFKSLRFFRRQHLGVILGTMLTASLITGALLVGDSVRGSLKLQAELRLGKIEYTVSASEILFTDQLAFKTAAILDTNITPVLQAKGIVLDRKTGLSVSQVNIIGVKNSFFSLFPAVKANSISPSSLSQTNILLNTRLASRLNAEKGAELLVRVEKINTIPAEVPLAAAQELNIPISCMADGILEDGAGGAFSIQAHQTMPMNLYIPIETLQEKMDLSGKANLLLIQEKTTEALSHEVIFETLDRSMSLDDFGISISSHSSGTFLTMDRIFIHTAVENAAKKTQLPYSHRLTYFANSIQYKNNITPYSFIEGRENAGVSDSQIIISDWLAEDLGTTSGDALQITYYYPETEAELTEKEASFSIQNILRAGEKPFSHEETPRFPGLTDVDNCRDWNPDIPIYFERIREKDEAYWDTYKAVPKIILSWEKAKSLFANRFGDSTALVFSSKQDITDLQKKLLANLSFSQTGIRINNSKETALNSASNGVDFGGLFLGMNFFIIFAGILLIVLLYGYTQKSRENEPFILSAVGIPPSKIFLFRLYEMAGISLIGSIAGVFGGIGYTMLILAGLLSVFSGAVGETALKLYINPVSMIIGCSASILLSIGIMIISFLRSRKTAAKKVKKNIFENPARFSCVIAALLSSAGILITIFFYSDTLNTAYFFTAAVCFLSGGILFFYSFLCTQEQNNKRAFHTIPDLAISFLYKNKRQSMTSVLFLALGIFIVVSVGANKSSLPSQIYASPAGTGGYELFIETTMPVQKEPKKSSFNTQWNIDQTIVKNSVIIPLRLHEGEDSSCLNLNKIQEPAITGINADVFIHANAFSFAGHIPDGGFSSPWELLDASDYSDDIPAIADQSVLQWGLGKDIGDRIEVTDEFGQKRNLVFVAGLENSVFQGSIIISEKNFISLFPSANGYKRFLVDNIDHEHIEEAREIFSQQLSRYGAEVMTGKKRLEMFHTVEDTYLMVFLVLGGIGILIGSVGYGIIIFKTLMERRHELAVFSAIGFSPRTVRLLPFMEFGIIIAAGLLIGTLSAFVALLPSVAGSLDKVPWIFIGLLIGSTGISTAVWIYISIRLAIPKNVLSALKNE